MNTTRKEFLFGVSAGLLLGRHLWGQAEAGAAPLVRFGMVTDLHFADIDPDPKPIGVVGRRFYRESRRTRGA